MSAVANPAQALHKPTQAKSKYRPEIDGLRAFAVVAVIINHFNKDLLPSGYLGVDIFFVISGYVITSSLADRKSKNFLDFLTGFYERRIKRLVPALVVFVLITGVLMCLFIPEPGSALTTGIASLFGLSNLDLFKKSTDYFAQSTELNPFTHTWSLGVEEQFYLVFPLLIWFSGFGRQAKNGARNLFLWSGGLTIASLIGFIYLYEVNQPAAYFLMPLRFWEMAAGCLIFIGFQKRARIEQALEQVPPLLVVTGMVGVMFLPVSAAVPGTIGVVVLSAILIACLKKGTTAYQFFTLEKVVYVGLISYSLYLWHWGVLSISRWTIGVHWWSVPMQVILIFILASSSYAFIEKPLRSFAPQKISSHWIIFAGLAALIGSATGLAATKTVRVSGWNLSNFLYVSANPDAKLSTLVLSNGIKKRQVTTALPWKHKANGIGASSLAKCHFSRPVSDADFVSCLKHSSTQNGSVRTPRIYIFGDSHAANYAFAIRKAFTDRTAMITTGFGCGYMSADDARKLNNANMNCSDYVLKVDRFVAKIRKGDVVVVGNDWGKKSSKRNSILQESAIRKLAKISTDREAYFVLLDDVPPLGDPFISLRRWYRPFPRPSISMRDVNKELSGLDAIGKRLTKDFQGAMYLSLRSGLCSAKHCSVTLGGSVTYLDDGHLTVEASEKLAFTVKHKLAYFLKP